MIRVRTGETFSRARLQASAKDISDRLGSEGYAFANVNAVPEIDREKAQVGVHVLHRPGPPRLRPPAQHHRQHEARATRSSAARCASSRAPGTTARASSAPRCASAGSATSTTSTSRRRRWRARRTRSTSRSRWRRSSTGNLLAGVGYSRAPTASCSTARSRSRTCSAAATRCRQRSTRATSTARSRSAHRAVLDRRRRVAHDRDLLAQDRTRRRCRCRSTPPTRSARAVGFGLPITETDTINVGARVEHTDLTLFADSPLVYYEFVARVRQSDQQLHRHVGWSRDTRDDILYPTRGRLQSRLRRGRASPRRPQVLQGAVPAPVVLAGVRRLRADAARRRRQRRTATATSRCRSSRRSTAAAWGRCAASSRTRSARRTSSATCWAAGARSSATPSSTTRSSRATSPSAGACSSTPARSPGASDRSPSTASPTTTMPAQPAVPGHGLRGLPLLGGRGSRVEFAGRPAQVQLRCTAEQAAGRPRAEFPVPGRQRVLTAGAWGESK